MGKATQSRRAGNQRAVSSQEIKEIQRQKVTRRWDELDDAEIEFEKSDLEIEGVARLCDECRAIRLRIEKDADQMLSKSVKLKLVNLKKELELRREKLRELLAPKEAQEVE